MNEETIPWIACAVVALVVAASAKGCNDSDNALFASAARAGCSVVRAEGGGREIFCPGYERVSGYRPTPTPAPEEK